MVRLWGSWLMACGVVGVLGCTMPNPAFRETLVGSDAGSGSASSTSETTLAPTTSSQPTTDETGSGVSGSMSDATGGPTTDDGMTTSDATTDDMTMPSQTDSETGSLCPDVLEPALDIHLFNDDIEVVGSCGTTYQGYGRFLEFNPQLQQSKFSICPDKQFCLGDEPCAATELIVVLDMPPGDVATFFPQVSGEQCLHFTAEMNRPFADSECHGSSLVFHDVGVNSEELLFAAVRGQIASPSAALPDVKVEWEQASICTCQSDCCALLPTLPGTFSLDFGGEKLAPHVTLEPNMGDTELMLGEHMAAAKNYGSAIRDACNEAPAFAWAVTRQPGG